MRESELEYTVNLLKDLLEAKPEKIERVRRLIELQRVKQEAAKEALVRVSDYCLAQARGMDAQIEMMKMLIGEVDE